MPTCCFHWVSDAGGGGITDLGQENRAMCLGTGLCMNRGFILAKGFRASQILPSSSCFLNPVGFLPRGLNNLMVLIIAPVIRHLLDAQENIARRR